MKATIANEACARGFPHFGRPGNDDGLTVASSQAIREQLNTDSADCDRPSIADQAGKTFAKLRASLAMRGFTLHKTPAGPWLIERAGAAA